MATTASFSFYAGEDVAVAVTMNPVVDITGWALKFTMRAQLNILPILVTKTTGGGGIVITSGPSGTFQVNILKDDTASALPGQYLFDIQRTDSGFAQVLTIGTITLLQPVANIPP